MRKAVLVASAVLFWMGAHASRSLAQSPYLVQVASTGAFRPGEWPAGVPALCVKHVAAATSRCLARTGDKWAATSVVNAPGPFSVELPMPESGEPIWVEFGAINNPIGENEALQLASKAIVAAGGLVPAPATPPLPVWEWLERASNFNRPPPATLRESLVVIFNCSQVQYQEMNGSWQDAYENVGGQQLKMKRWSEVVSFKVGGGIVSPAPGTIKISGGDPVPADSLRCASSREVDFSGAVAEFVTTGDRWLRSVVLDALNDNFLRGALIELIKGDPAAREALLRIAATEEAARSQTRETFLHLLSNDAAFKDEVRQILGLN